MAHKDYRVLRDALERTLRGRTYDRHAYDEETFEELLDDLVEDVKAYLAPEES